jgi:hypothetical protein
MNAGYGVSGKSLEWKKGFKREFAVFYFNVD